MQASRISHPRAGLIQIARGIGTAVLDSAPANRPPVYFPASDGMRSWSRLRMQVVQHHGCRCYRCGRPGDEITLQVNLEKLVPLCGHCQ
jgi:hypothetical protein